MFRLEGRVFRWKGWIGRIGEGGMVIEKCVRGKGRNISLIPSLLGRVFIFILLIIFGDFIQIQKLM